MNDWLNEWIDSTAPVWLGDVFRWPVILAGPVLLGLMLLTAHRSRWPYKWAIWAGCAAGFTSVGRSIDFLGTGMSYAVVLNFLAVAFGYIFLWKWYISPQRQQRGDSAGEDGGGPASGVV